MILCAQFDGQVDRQLRLLTQLKKLHQLSEEELSGIVSGINSKKTGGRDWRNGWGDSGGFLNR